MLHLLAVGLLLCAGFCLGLAQLAYQMLAIRAVMRFRERPESAAAGLPPVSILVPAHGDRAGLYECLRAVCEQDYPDFEIVFGLHRRDDAARPVIERVMREFPHLRTTLVVDERRIGTNPKNCNLANMYPAARHDIIAMIDSDTHVGRGFLRAVVAEFDRPEIGAVTCLYKARALPDLPSRLGALAMNDWVLPSGLVDVMLREEHICYGPAIVATRAAIDATGGFAAMGSAVAQDYVLGREMRRHGYRLRLARYFTETIVAEASLMQLFHRERRWNQAVRALRPVDHALSLTVHALPVTLALLLLGGAGPVALALLLAIAVSRLFLHYCLRGRLGISGRAVPWLLPLRECFSLAVWVSSFFDRTMRWDRHRLLARGGMSTMSRDA